MSVNVCSLVIKESTTHMSNVNTELLRYILLLNLPLLIIVTSFFISKHCGLGLEVTGGVSHFCELSEKDILHLQATLDMNIYIVRV